MNFNQSSAQGIAIGMGRRRGSYLGSGRAIDFAQVATALARIAPAPAPPWPDWGASQFTPSRRRRLESLEELGRVAGDLRA